MEEHIKLPYELNTWSGIVDILSKNKCTNTNDFTKMIHDINNLMNPPVLNNGLHDVIDNLNEYDIFISKIIPYMKDIVLKMPILIPSSLPVLKKGSNGSLSLHRLQVLCLICAGFLNCFNDSKVYKKFNFSNLFSLLLQKLVKTKMLITYIIYMYDYYDNYLQGYVNEKDTITYKRQSIKTKHINWKDDVNIISQVQITTTNRIDDIENGFQILTCNKNFGAYTLSDGYDAESIRMCCNPELLLTMLFCENMSSNESIIVYGAQKYSSYSVIGSKVKYLDLANEKAKTNVNIKKAKSRTSISDDSSSSSSSDDEDIKTNTHKTKTKKQKVSLYYDSDDEDNEDNIKIVTKKSKCGSLIVDPLSNLGICLINIKSNYNVKKCFQLKFLYKCLNKMLSGIISRGDIHTPIVSGEWGYNDRDGYPNVMILIQICACARAQRNLLLCFEETEDRFSINELQELIKLCISKQVTISQLLLLIPEFPNRMDEYPSLYMFLISNL